MKLWRVEHFWTYLSSLLGVITEYNSNHAQKWRQICPKVFNSPEFHFSEVTFLQNWYFNSKFSGLKICIMASNKIPETPILSRNLKQFAYLALMSSYFCPLKWIRFFSNSSKSPFFAQQFPIFSTIMGGYSCLKVLYFLLFSYVSIYSAFKNIMLWNEELRTCCWGFRRVTDIGILEIPTTWIPGDVVIRKKMVFVDCAGMRCYTRCRCLGQCDTCFHLQCTSTLRPSGTLLFSRLPMMIWQKN